mmetsp:Transcript_2947/g.8512  ORF Transcript_2947/g.8512 Transcript_2947/m.8512 type:complete len:300 (-) Transcript_2947:346-1245(-)
MMPVMGLLIALREGVALDDAGEDGHVLQGPDAVIAAAEVVRVLVEPRVERLGAGAPGLEDLVDAEAVAPHVVRLGERVLDDDGVVDVEVRHALRVGVQPAEVHAAAHAHARRARVELAPVEVQEPEQQRPQVPAGVAQRLLQVPGHEERQGVAADAAGVARAEALLLTELLEDQRERPQRRQRREQVQDEAVGAHAVVLLRLEAHVQPDRKRQLLLPARIGGLLPRRRRRRLRRPLQLALRRRIKVGLVADGRGRRAGGGGGGARARALLRRLRRVVVEALRGPAAVVHRGHRRRGEGA